MLRIWGITYTFAFLLLLAGCGSHPATHSPGFTGNESSGGGSASAAEFTDIAYKAVPVLSTIPGFPISGVEFEWAVKNTHVEFTDESLRDPNGLQVDALNFPDRQLIRVNRAHWLLLGKSVGSKYQLVIHEYLGILRIDDTGYRVSNLVIYGGVELISVSCWYPGGNLSWSVIDPTGSGDLKVDAWFSDPGGEESPVAVAESSGAPVLSWSDSRGLQTAQFPKVERLKSKGELRVPHFLRTGVNRSSAPIYRNDGFLKCLIKQENKNQQPSQTNN